jgi:uncharacterized membrane protein YqaE (UPF0057 family)
MRLKLFTLLAFSFFLTSTGFSAVAIVPALHTNPISGFDSSMVKDAVAALKALPRKERKQKLKGAKHLIKDYKAAKKAGQDPDTNTLLLAILAIFLPPLAVYLHQGEVNNKFWITLLLFLVGILGAFTIGWFLILLSIIYALYIILGNN